MKVAATAFLTATVLLIVLVAAASIYGRRAPNFSADDPDFIFKRGRLWASIDGGHAALVDSGTSMSVFPKDWNALGKAEGSERVSTPFGEGALSLHQIGPLKIGGSTFEGKVLAGDVPFPIIGADFIFSKNNVLFTHRGLEFDVVYEPANAVACVVMATGYGSSQSATTGDPIDLLLKIDGLEQKVFFDTGIAPALQASASLPRSVKKLFPRMDIRANALGQSSLAPYFSRQAWLSLGSQQDSLDYRHYYLDRSVAAPFVMGAGILKKYSILIDIRKRRACFFESK